MFELCDSEYLSYFTMLKHSGRVTYYPFVSKTYVGALARESGAKSPCKWGSDSDLCNKEHK